MALVERGGWRAIQSSEPFNTRATSRQRQGKRHRGQRHVRQDIPHDAETAGEQAFV